MTDRQATQKYIIEKIRQSVQLMDDTQDSISRKKAVDAINKYDFEFPEYMERFVTELRDAMKEDLKHDIEELPPAQQWIPVTERPPVREGWYNVTIVVGDSHYTYYDVSTLYMKDGKWHDYDCGGFEEFKMPVIAWMPLPEPYEGGDAK